MRGGLEEWIYTEVNEPGLLFNLADDPGETTDLAAGNPVKVSELRAIIQRVAPEKINGQKKLNKKDLGF